VIRFRTLGSLDLRNGQGNELNAVLAQPKRVALLAYLALAGPQGSHRRDTLVAVFWPEHDAEHARNALSQATHFLRRFLGAEALVTRNGDGLGLNWDDFWCDALEFEKALDSGRVAEALDLYRGDLLDGFHVADAPEFERWLDAERARLAARYGSAVEALASEREAAGDVQAAVTYWRRLVVRDPYNSRTTLRLLRALVNSGDSAGAIRHARVHETLLRDEMDAAPGPEITALVRKLHSRGDDAAVSSPSTVPKAVGVATSVSAAAVSPLTPDLTSPPAERVRRLERRRRRRAMLAVTGVLGLCAVAAVIAAQRSALADPPRPTIRSLAVLPFASLSGDSIQDGFADGMHDALITELALYPDFSVISRQSVMRYKGTKMSLPDIARDLKVDGVVEGTVLREGGRVRMNAQLVHGPTDRHLWAGSYKRDLGDILVLQSELADAIARELRVVTAPVHRARRPVAGHRDSLPDELFLGKLYERGRTNELSRSLTGILTAKESYRQAIERDSTYALAYAGLAGAYGFMADYDFASMGPALDSARMMARRAVSLDSTLPETRTALAVTLGDAGDFAGAEREFKRAIELGPSNARAHFWYSILLVALGRGQEAQQQAKRAMELEPFAPRGLTGMQRYAHWLVTGDRPYLRLPVDQRRPVLKLEPGEPWARSQEALEWAREGRCDKAREELARAQHLAPESRRMLAPAASVYWLCGDRKRARAIVDEMKRRPDAYEHGYRVALAYTVFGEKDSALVWLARNRWTMAELSGLSADQRMDPLRSDPRFGAILRRIGIR
jgi:DNA-binding SARP family transcriptional activator/TolB-like protein/Flp pilus assembly protein TadD